ncbi:MAG: NAD(P)(+) transhydrogenase (Re/Si-specific) subunit beta [Proteobacteria bacterium]|nr:NAD(P)(+) transhydrogenase (Re/Si-specific) subunit beta [Pseudomonadota bacterium]
MTTQFISFAYLIAAVCFIMALRGLASPETARRGNVIGIVGMVIAIVTTLASSAVLSYELIVVGIIVGGAIGTVTALKIKMTALPQLIAAFHSLVGLAAVCIAAAAFHAPEAYGIAVGGVLTTASLIELAIGTAVGALTFSGSIVAFAKLQGLISGAPVRFAGQHALNALLGLSLAATVGWFCLGGGASAFWPIVALSLALGLLIIIPIGGADMPVVISMLNSYSGWAACGIGFTLANPLLIITGALVGSSGAILSYIMCKSMNRSFLSVILGGIGANADADPAATRQQGDRPVKVGSAEDAAFVMKNASKVIIVPGYGMAVAQAQHALREMGDLLKAAGVEVSYAIHPVAGRMPGHMNVLLAEANVPYDEVFELEQINNDFSTADVAFVIGANDVTNPAAKTDPTSPIYGMPILDVARATSVLFVKRSMASGYAGVDNELFSNDNTMMLFDDAKKMTEKIVQAIG